MGAGRGVPPQKSLVSALYRKVHEDISLLIVNAV